jgi:CheY-like chemotaxis protein
MTCEKPLVILVDDDDVDAFILRKAFSRAEICVEFEHVLGCAELMERLFGDVESSTLTNKIPDVMLLDVNMPAINGFEVLRRLRSFEKTIAIPIVMFTTSSLPDDVKKSYAMGANSYIVKPNNIDELVECVKGFHSYWFNRVQLPSLAS